MTKKWYLSTWFISILFAFWMFIIPPIIGILLLALQIKEEKKQKKAWEESGIADALNAHEKKKELEKDITQLNVQKDQLLEKMNVLDDLSSIQQEIRTLTEQKEQLLARLGVLDELDDIHRSLEETKQETQRENEEAEEIRSVIHLLNEEIKQKKDEIIVLDDEILYQSFGFYETKYNLEDSAQYKERLKEIRQKQKEMAKSKEAVDYFDGWVVNNSKVEGRKMTRDNIKQVLYAFNTDCDNAIGKVKFNNIHSIEKLIESSYNKINRMNEKNRIAIRREYLDLKLEELYLAYEYAKKKEEEKEEQRQIKEEMREAEKVRREIEAMKRKIEKEELHFNQEILALTKRIQEADEEEKAALEAKIKELEDKLALVEKDKEHVFNREQNTRAGYVYIISNIGSFGEHVYKIGLTRRLEPMDRVRELGDASVPFIFDVHAMIFSEDAPALENALHKEFDHKRVNKVNGRKEFFRVTLEEIEEVVKNNHNEVVEFTKLAKAEQYRESLMIEESRKQQKHLMHA